MTAVTERILVSACRQVEVWPSGLASIAPEALLVGRQEVKAINTVILSKVGVLMRACVFVC